MDVKVDDRERGRISLAKDYYGKITVKHLDTGDFIFDDKVCFEYKTLNDFIGSIRDRRVFKQVQRMNKYYPFHFVIIETGNGIDSINPWSIKVKNKQVLKNMYYGAISSLSTVTKVLQAPTTAECFYLMKKTAKKHLDGKVHAKPTYRKTGNAAKNFLTYCVDGVGNKNAELITTTLNLNSLNDLLTLTSDDLTSIKGIGEIMANKILKQVHGEG